MRNSLERRVRSRILGLPFVASNALTKFEVFGRNNLLAAIDRHQRGGRGLITISNHQSLFDDPMVLAALLGLRDLTVESKAWWSTPCQSNFSPQGDGLRDRFVRYFSDVSNMVFFARRKKGENYPLPASYLDALASSDREELVARIAKRAAALRTDSESYLRSFVTPGDRQGLASLNQLGMVEACARVDLGYWLHFFPEATRSRKLGPREAKRGVGKILYHCPDAEVLPICFCGMHRVLPVGSLLPRPLQRVVVFVGEPVPARRLALLRTGAADADRFQALASAAWESVQSLWPLALARYQRQRAAVAPFTLPRRPAAQAESRRVPAPATATSQPVRTEVASPLPPPV